MSDVGWIVTYHTTSTSPCPACIRLEETSPFAFITDSISVPDADSLRPHGNCVCYIDLEGGVLLADSDYVVRDLEVDIASSSENETYLTTHSNPSRSVTREVSVSGETEVTAEVSVSTSYDVEGIGSIESSLSASSSASSGYSQTAELEPRTRINEYLHTQEISATIRGTLVDRNTGHEYGPTFVGTLYQTITTHYLDDVEDMD